MAKDIVEFITTEKIAYETMGVPVVDQFEWAMYKHIQLCTLYKDGKLSTGNTDDKPIKNIILPIVNVAYRTEGFDVKDIQPFVNDEKNYYKSFIVEKYHEKWARENDLDTFIDDMVESYVDYGGVFVRDEKDRRPKVIPLQTIAFCDQTDLLTSPFGIKHMYSPDQLLEMSDTWDKDKIDLCITKADSDKDVQQSQGQKAKTPGKYIEIYEVHGVLPKSWLATEANTYEEEKNYIRQVQIVAMFRNESGDNEGITLYKGKEKDGLFKLLKRDKRFGTALGRSAIEELFEPQVWTNYNLIQIKKMLDAAAIMILQTSDPTIAQRNKLEDLKKGKIITHAEGAPITQVTFQPQNIQSFENALVEWENHARITGSANDAALGINPSAGTPFKLQELLTQEGRGMHDYRRGKIATFMAEIYRDWILRYLVNDMNKEQSFITELSLDELNQVADAIVTNYTNDLIKKRILGGEIIPAEEVDALRDKTKAQFMKAGNKRFIKIMKNELKSVPIDVEVNVAGKQKNLSEMTDKLTNIIRQIIAAPQVLQDPNVAKIFNDLLESSGFSPINFVPSKAPQIPQAQLQKPQISPLQNNQLTNNNQTNG